MLSLKVPAISRLKAAYLQKVERAMDLAQFAAYVSAKSTTLFNNRTGNLRRSIRAGRSRTARFVSANTSYAAFVEYGTRFMASRPFMRTAHKVGVAALKKALGG